jgi:hypothetical protein
MVEFKVFVELFEKFAGWWKRREDVVKILPWAGTVCLVLGLCGQFSTAQTLWDGIHANYWLWGALGIGVIVPLAWGWSSRRVLLRDWPLARSVTIHHWMPPRVTRDGRVDVFLRVTNHSPFGLLFYHADLLPTVGGHPCSDVRTMPPLKLPASGGTERVQLTAKVSARVKLVDEVEVFMEGLAKIERECDHTATSVGLVTEAAGRDALMLVRVVGDD